MRNNKEARLVANSPSFSRSALLLLLSMVACSESTSTNSTPTPEPVKAPVPVTTPKAVDTPVVTPTPEVKKLTKATRKCGHKVRARAAEKYLNKRLPLGEGDSYQCGLGKGRKGDLDFIDMHYETKTRRAQVAETLWCTPKHSPPRHGALVVAASRCGKVIRYAN